MPWPFGGDKTPESTEDTRLKNHPLFNSDNPKPVPHNARLDKAMEPGQLVTIKGQAMEINLKEEGINPTIVFNLSSSDRGMESSTIPLHISIRFKHKEMVLNSLNDGEWGKEEKKKLPFTVGEKFDFRIRAHSDKFEITVDGKEFATFEHRLPLSDVNHVFIDGPLLLFGVNWGGKYYSVPFETGIAGGFAPGKRLFVSGVPERKADAFYVALKTRTGDVALKFNASFDDKAVIRNAKQGDEWGNEEKEGKLPFTKDIGFDLVIQNESYSFQVYVNDERFCTFAHRMDPESIVGVEIGGDVELQSLMVA